MALPAFRISDKRDIVHQATNNIYKATPKRKADLDINPHEFKFVARKLVDQLSEFMQTIEEQPVTTDQSPSEIRNQLPDSVLPQNSANPFQLVEETANLLFKNSLLNGHPKFMGYITSSPAPIGALAEMMAAVINANVGGWSLSPMASEIEKQTISWIAEMIGFPVDAGGLMTSGGNMANFTALLTARKNKATWDNRTEGNASDKQKKLIVYATKETHTWLEKAADMAGLGTDSVRYVPMDVYQQMVPALLKSQIERDLDAGHLPFMVVGNAGTTATGAVDPIKDIAMIARQNDLWFHIDGAYGAFAANVDGAPGELQNLHLADSIAVDPHKWLYAPLDAGCVLVKNKEHLRDAFSAKPSYYKFETVKGEAVDSFYDFGPENSRSFRALKVWLGFKQAGLNGYRKMIADDIQLSQELFFEAELSPLLESITNNLSITTFRYVPRDLQNSEENYHEEYLNHLNQILLTRLQESGRAFVSNAVVDGKYVLRACIVNFRTSAKDISEMVNIITEIGDQVDGELRSRITLN